MISFIIIFLASLFFTGIVIRTKSIASGRKGPGLMQPLKDIFRLLRKGTIYSETSGLIFRLAPLVYFSTVIFAIMILPVGKFEGLISFQGNFIMFAYILALGKFFMIIASLDTGSSFEGMGASREALYSMLVEPAFFIIIGSFALLTGCNSFYDIFTHLKFGNYFVYLIGGLAAFIFIMIAMIENSRMPVDDPKTHLELTMIHEVMILDTSGFDLGMILHTTNLKFAMYGAIVANFFIESFSSYNAIILFFVIQFVFAVSVGLIESFMARFRMNHNPQFIFILSAVSMIIFFSILLIMGKIA